MDKTQDYIYFLKENDYLLGELREHVSLTYDLLFPVIIVLDELVSKDLNISDLSNTINLLYQSVEQKRNLAQEEIDYIDKLVDNLLKEEDYLSIPDRYIEIADNLGLDLF